MNSNLNYDVYADPLMTNIHAYRAVALTTPCKRATRKALEALIGMIPNSDSLSERRVLHRVQTLVSPEYLLSEVQEVLLSACLFSKRGRRGKPSTIDNRVSQ